MSGWAVGISAAVSAIGIGVQAMTPSPKMPQAVVPAAAASGAREDTGAQVKLGVNDVKDSRVSGVRKNTTSSSSVDVLGGLGRGGLSV